MRVNYFMDSDYNHDMSYWGFVQIILAFTSCFIVDIIRVNLIMSRDGEAQISNI